MWLYIAQLRRIVDLCVEDIPISCVFHLQTLTCHVIKLCNSEFDVFRRVVDITENNRALSDWKCFYYYHSLAWRKYKEV